MIASRMADVCAERNLARPGAAVRAGPVLAGPGCTRTSVVRWATANVRFQAWRAEAGRPAIDSLLTFASSESAPESGRSTQSFSARPADQVQSWQWHKRRSRCMNSNGDITKCVVPSCHGTPDSVLPCLRREG